MFQVLETHLNNFTISTDASRLDVDSIAEMLARSYWANKRTRKQLERALKNSLVFGLYNGNQQIGLARVISDFAVFAYLCDVFIHEDYRGQGLGKWLLENIHTHPDLQGLRRWILVTRDAHAYYRQFGWEILPEPERWMSIFDG